MQIATKRILVMEITDKLTKLRKFISHIIIVIGVKEVSDRPESRINARFKSKSAVSTSVRPYIRTYMSTKAIITRRKLKVLN